MPIPKYLKNYLIFTNAEDKFIKNIQYCKFKIEFLLFLIFQKIFCHILISINTFKESEL